MGGAKRKKGYLPPVPLRRHPGSKPGLEHVGRFFDLLEIFRRLNTLYFRDALPPYRVIWGRRRRHRPRNYFIFASIQEEKRLIRVHPLLDAPFVPLWFMESVLYHEMLHAVVPDGRDAGGRRIVHTEEFCRREREFPYYRRAARWERENLGRFLR